MCVRQTEVMHIERWFPSWKIHLSVKTVVLFSLVLL